MPISEVYNMDCMEYMKGIPDKFFDLAIVDPQYGIDIMHKGGMPKHLGFKQYKRKDWDKSPPQPVRERLFWDVSHRAEPLSRLHLSPSKGISFFILKF